MIKKVGEYKYTEYASLDELSAGDIELIEIARIASQTAYSPYSGYKVGAAVLLANGEIVSGSNQENAAYPSGLCAERTALFYASSQFPKIAVKKLAITTLGNNALPTDFAKPCGACRQVIAEYEDIAGKPIKIILDSEMRIIVIEGIDILLPFRFKKDDLAK